MAGANRSRRLRHHRIGPWVRANTPAANRAAAAPSRGPLPPPATSWSAPKAKPPPGSRSSISGTRNGKTPRETQSPASIRRIFSRRASIWAGAAVMAGFNWHLRYMFPFRSFQGRESMVVTPMWKVRLLLFLGSAKAWAQNLFLTREQKLERYRQAVTEEAFEIWMNSGHHFARSIEDRIAA